MIRVSPGPIRNLTIGLIFKKKGAGNFDRSCRRVAQRESASLTRKKSAVRNRPRLPEFFPGIRLSVGFAVVGLPQRFVPSEAFLYLARKFHEAPDVFGSTGEWYGLNICLI